MADAAATLLLCRLKRGSRTSEYVPNTMLGWRRPRSRTATTRRSSDLSKHCAEVFAEAEDHPVTVTRRDGAPLVLMSQREAEGRARLLEFAAQLIGVALDDDGPLADRMSRAFPWMLALPAEGRTACAQALVDAARASFSTDQPHLALAELTSWRETATAIAAGHGRDQVDDRRSCTPTQGTNRVGSSVYRGVYRLRPSWHPRYQSDVYVPADLRHLAGPTSGRYDPPVNLYWQPGALNFADQGDIELFYSSALAAANTAEEFTQWINGRALAKLWPRLALPSRVRGAWETIHPHLRSEDVEVNDRISVQDAILTAIAEQGFALASGSALIDYDVVTRESEDIDTFNDRWDVAEFDKAHEKVLTACRESGWSATTVHREESDRKIRVDSGTGTPVVVQLVYYGRSRNPRQRATGGLRLVFEDVVGGKGAAVADVARGRDFDDLAHIVETPGWSLERVEDAMRAIKYGDQIGKFRANIVGFRRGEFDDDIRKSGFDPAYSHRVLG